MKSVCLAILNYNGRKHLEHLLPTACEAAEKFSGTCAVVVIDNQSTDDDVAWIQREFPSVETVVAPKNNFLFSYNWLAQKRTEDILVLLNNDLKVDRDFIAPLIKDFESPDVFSASARSYDWNGDEVTSGPARLKFNNGFYSWKFDTEHQKRSHTLFTSGGFMAVDRNKFIELGGLTGCFIPPIARIWIFVSERGVEGGALFTSQTATSGIGINPAWSNHSKGSLNSLELRNLLLMQWSTFPMRKGRWTRLHSLAKLLIASLFSDDRVWIKTYPATLVHWLTVRRRYLWMKIHDRELSQIVSRTETEC